MKLLIELLKVFLLWCAKQSAVLLHLLQTLAGIGYRIDNTQLMPITSGMLCYL